jgi:hypothetical protein
MLGDAEIEYRQKCRLRALEVARDMKPQPIYNSGLGLTQALPMPVYNLLAEAENIYQWLIKIEDNVPA